jgi:hypothetical protein
VEGTIACVWVKERAATTFVWERKCRLYEICPAGKGVGRTFVILKQLSCME